MNLPINFYVVASFLNFITSFGLAFILLKNYRFQPSRLFSLISFSVAGWSLFYCIWLLQSTEALAEFYLRTCMIGVIFIPPLLIHFVTIFINKPRNKKTYICHYLFSSIIALTVYTPLYAKNPERFLVFPYWLHPGPVFHIAIIYFGIIGFYSWWLMYRTLKKAKGTFRNQLIYICICTIVGYVGGSTNYFCWYRIPIPPILNSLVAFYVLFVAVAIVKYKLWDIHFVFRQWITNTLLAMVLGTVILWDSIIPTTIITKVILSYAIALIAVIFLPKVKSKIIIAIKQVLYKQKYNYQDKLETFIEQMVLIPQEEHLLKDTATTLGETLGTGKVAMFILDPIKNNYLLKIQIGLDNIDGDFVIEQGKLTQWLQKHKDVFVKEETEKTFPQKEIDAISVVLNSLAATVCIPLRLKEDLIGIITLGEKSSGEMYSHIDTAILKRLGTQLAIALDYRRIEAQLRNKQEQQAIGQMSMEMGHEIRNLLVTPHTFLDMILERKDDPEFMGSFRDLAIDRLHVIRGKLDDIMYFGEDHVLNLTPGIDVHKIIDDSLAANEYRVKQYQIEVVKEYGSFPALKADHNQLVHLFNNLILNAVDAMQNKLGGKLRIRTRLYENLTVEMKENSPQWIRVEIKDDGEGIPERIMEKLFTAFVTTKSGGGIQRKGTGLGLCVVKKAVDAHKGYIYIHSNEGKGTTAIVDLPLNLKVDQIILEGIKREKDKEPWE